MEAGGLHSTSGKGGTLDHLTALPQATATGVWGPAPSPMPPLGLRHVDRIHR